MTKLRNLKPTKTRSASRQQTTTSPESSSDAASPSDHVLPVPQPQPTATSTSTAVQLPVEPPQQSQPQFSTSPNFVATDPQPPPLPAEHGPGVPEQPLFHAPAAVTPSPTPSSQRSESQASQRSASQASLLSHQNLQAHLQAPVALNQLLQPSGALLYPVANHRSESRVSGLSVGSICSQSSNRDIMIALLHEMQQIRQQQAMTSTPLPVRPTAFQPISPRDAPVPSRQSAQFSQQLHVSHAPPEYFQSLSVTAPQPVVMTPVTQTNMTHSADYGMAVRPPQLPSETHQSRRQHMHRTSSSPSSLREAQPPLHCVTLTIPVAGKVLDPNGYYHNFEDIITMYGTVPEGFAVIPNTPAELPDNKIRQILCLGSQRSPGNGSSSRHHQPIQSFTNIYTGTDTESFPKYINSVVAHVSNESIAAPYIVHVIARGLRGAPATAYSNWTTSLNDVGVVLTQLPGNHIVAALAFAFWHQRNQQNHIAVLRSSLHQTTTERNTDFLHRFRQETYGLAIPDQQKINMLRGSVHSKFQLPFPSGEDMTYEKFDELMDLSAVNSLSDRLPTTPSSSFQIPVSHPQQVNAITSSSLDGLSPSELATLTSIIKKIHRKDVSEAEFDPQSSSRQHRTSSASTSQNPRPVNRQSQRPVTQCSYCQLLHHTVDECRRKMFDDRRALSSTRHTTDRSPRSHVPTAPPVAPVESPPAPPASDNRPSKQSRTSTRQQGDKQSPADQSAVGTRHQSK